MELRIKFEEAKTRWLSPLCLTPITKRSYLLTSFPEKQTTYICLPLLNRPSIALVNYSTGQNKELRNSSYLKMHKTKQDQVFPQTDDILR